MVAMSNGVAKALRVPVLPKYNLRPPITGPGLREKSCDFTVEDYTEEMTGEV